MPPQSPAPQKQNSASAHPSVASGNSQRSAVQLSLISASVDQPWTRGTYFHKVREYHSKGIRYYRYTCNVGHDVIHDEHIPGGNVHNPAAKARAKQVKRWIEQGKLPDEIVKSIRKWRR